MVDQLLVKMLNLNQNGLVKLVINKDINISNNFYIFKIYFISFVQELLK